MEATTPQIEGIKLPMIIELGVDPTSSKPILMSITPAIKLEDIPDRTTTERTRPAADRSRPVTDRARSPQEEYHQESSRKKEKSREWKRVDAGVVRNAVPEVNMPEFKREVTQITKVIVNELHDKQNRVTVRYISTLVLDSC